MTMLADFNALSEAVTQADTAFKQDAPRLFIGAVYDGQAATVNAMLADKRFQDYLATQDGKKVMEQVLDRALYVEDTTMVIRLVESGARAVGYLPYMLDEFSNKNTDDAYSPKFHYTGGKGYIEGNMMRLARWHASPTAAFLKKVGGLFPRSATRELQNAPKPA